MPSNQYHGFSSGRNLCLGDPVLFWRNELQKGIAHQGIRNKRICGASTTVLESRPFSSEYQGNNFLASKLQKVNRFFLFACRQDTFFQGWGGGNGFLYQRERENLKRDLNTHCLKIEKVTARASFRGMSCWTPRQVCPSVNEKDIGFEVPSETGQANLAPPTIPRVCYISVPWVPLSLRPTTASRGWKIEQRGRKQKLPVMEDRRGKSKIDLIWILKTRKK